LLHRVWVIRMYASRWIPHAQDKVSLGSEQLYSLGGLEGPKTPPSLPMVGSGAAEPPQTPPRSVKFARTSLLFCHSFHKSLTWLCDRCILDLPEIFRQTYALSR